MEIAYTVFGMLYMLKNDNCYFMLSKHLLQGLKCTN